MKIGLYFGSFNPVHVGHCIIASHVVNHTELEQVWFIVSPQNPFKRSNSLLNEYHRLHLVQLAIEGEGSLKASDIEFGLRKPSYTADTLVYLQEKYPRHQFSLVMGSDGFQNLPKWKNAPILMANYKIYVYIRPGFPIENAANVEIELLYSPLLQISSTHIRENIKQKNPFDIWSPKR